jgi:hypothetical protein
LKAILGDVSSCLKFSVDEKVKGNPVNTCIALSDFERVLRYFDRKGNETAIAITDSMVGLSLTQLFYDQFGIEFGKENRKQWLEARNSGKIISVLLLCTCK